MSLHMVFVIFSDIVQISSLMILDTQHLSKQKFNIHELFKLIFIKNIYVHNSVR